MANKLNKYQQIIHDLDQLMSDRVEERCGEVSCRAVVDRARQAGFEVHGDEASGTYTLRPAVETCPTCGADLVGSLCSAYCGSVS